MSAPRIRKCDKGTEYAKALTRAHRTGFAHASEDDAMAGFCEVLPYLVGAVSPRLVWEGAISYGLTTADLQKLAHDRDLDWLDALQFEPPFIPLAERPVETLRPL
jgi:hypothetical protein